MATLLLTQFSRLPTLVQATSPELAQETTMSAEDNPSYAPIIEQIMTESENMQSEIQPRMSVEEFLADFRTEKEFLENIITEHKDVKLSLDEEFLVNAIRLAKGASNMDVETFSSKLQNGFAAELLNQANNLDSASIEILQNIQDGKLKVMRKSTNTTVKLLRFKETDICFCPKEKFHLACLSRAALTLIRTGINFYAVTKATKIVLRAEAILSLKYYLGTMTKALERIKEFANPDCPTGCIKVSVQRRQSECSNEEKETTNQED